MDTRLGLWAAAGLALAVFAAACASDDGSSGAGAGPFVAGSNTQSALDDPYWGVLLTHHAGRNARAEAERSAAALREVLDRNDIRVRDSGDRAVVLLGRHDGPRTAKARDDLQMVRTLSVSGRRLFPTAYLQPPAVDTAGGLPQYSLDRALDEDPTARYTLQIGAYEHSGGSAAARRAAEDAVEALRAEGEQAYFHHTAWVSTVVIGLFNNRHVDPATNRPTDPQLLALMERYPHNLVNGYTVTTNVGGREAVQSSRLVLVPRSGR
ncbi:MAG: hypothetical protein AAGI30_08745 [Planctomycetota bacterium]